MSVGVIPAAKASSEMPAVAAASAGASKSRGSNVPDLVMDFPEIFHLDIPQSLTESMDFYDGKSMDELEKCSMDSSIDLPEIFHDPRSQHERRR